MIVKYSNVSDAFGGFSITMTLFVLKIVRPF